MPDPEMSTEPKRAESFSLMPERLNLGQQMSATMAHCMGQYDYWKRGKIDPRGRRTAMGFVLPEWQRGAVWTRAQQVAFVENAWRGVPLGNYSYNQAGFGSPHDRLLIDGQQRMLAIQAYIEDEFPVFGCHWSEVPARDERRWSMTTSFACYVTTSEDEAFLRVYYDVMNFGGTSHQESERATAPKP